MTPELEQLAALIDSHGLTRLEYEKGDLRVVMERQIGPGGQMSLPASSGQFGMLSPYQGAANHPAPTGPCPGASSHSSEGGELAAGAPSHPSASGELAAAGSNPVAAAAAAAATSETSSASAGPDIVTVTAPLVGVVYRSREPGATPLVERGQRVAAGDVACLIEAMKLFNEITAPVSGVIDAVLFEDGDLAEYGAPLITILPDID
jgi:biotin carboxyl carrier protein